MKKRAFFYIIAAGVLWGTSGIFVNYLVPKGYHSLQLTAVRGVVSLLFFAIYSAFRDRRAFKVSPKELLFFLGVGLSQFGTAAFYFMSMTATSISTAVVLMYTAPIYVTVFSALFLGEKFSKPKILALCMMIVGCAFVSGLVGGLRFDLLGIIFGIISGISYASYNILTKISMMHSYSPVSQNLYGALFMMLVSLAVCNPGEILPLTAKEPLTLTLALVALGVVTFVLPYLFFALGMKELPAATASALSTVEPLSACAFGIIIFGEKPDIFSLVGIALILVAVFLLGHSEKANSKTI
ncbi:MAG: EamA family transporter [Clostridia bacterium]|nr:EamA family transporter [Clostridia bacterium]